MCADRIDEGASRNGQIESDEREPIPESVYSESHAIHLTALEEADLAKRLGFEKGCITQQAASEFEKISVK